MWRVNSQFVALARCNLRARVGVSLLDRLEKLGFQPLTVGVGAEVSSQDLILISGHGIGFGHTFSDSVYRSNVKRP